MHMSLAQLEALLESTARPMLCAWFLFFGLFGIRGHTHSFVVFHFSWQKKKERRPKSDTLFISPPLLYNLFCVVSTFFRYFGLISLRFPPRMRGNGKGERKKKPARRRKKAKGKNDLKRRVQFRVCPKLRVFLPFGGRSEAEAEAKKTFTGFFALRGRLGGPTKRYDWGHQITMFCQWCEALVLPLTNIVPFSSVKTVWCILRWGLSSAERMGEREHSQPMQCNGRLCEHKNFCGGTPKSCEHSFFVYLSFNLMTDK